MNASRSSLLTASRADESAMGLTVDSHAAERRLVGHDERRLLVVSHASVVPVNQRVYVRLRERGWDPLLVVPKSWKHEYGDGAFAARPLPELAQTFVSLPVALRGRPQRHLYLARPGRMIRALSPDAIFLEEESFSVPAYQWGLAASRAGVPFGVQAAENLDRSLPVPARIIRAWVLRHAAFVAARSPRAAELARQWGATGQISLIPHAVPDWQPAPRIHRAEFTVGYAGRLVDEKGIWDLVEATRRLPGPVRLLLVGDGPLRDQLAGTVLPNGCIEICRGVSHDRMPELYAEMDVLVLPSRSTARWTEQFGRVLVEALWCGVPVVGSSCGEIPWVIETTGGGLAFPEGDVEALSLLLRQLHSAPDRRAALARSGRLEVERRFSLDAASAALDEAVRASLDLSRPQEPRNSQRRPRVALVAHAIHDHGGMERALYELIKRSAGDFSYIVFSTELSADLRPLVQWERIRVISRPIPLKFLMFFVIAGLRLARTPADLVHTCGALVPNRADLASVHLCHAGLRDTGGARSVNRPLPRRMNSMFARVLGLAAERLIYGGGRVRMLAAVSSGVAGELQTHYPNLRVRCTPNGVSDAYRSRESTRDEVRGQFSAGADDIVMIFVGSDWDHKGLGLGLDALALARRRVAPTLRLWVVGRGDEGRYRAAAERLGIDQLVTFLGFRTDLHRLYPAADLFLLPSTYESFSLAAYEAAASELPVVATRVSGIDELIGNDEAGIVIERDPEVIATALERLTVDSQLRARLGREARRRAASYTWERSVQAVLGCYDELLDQRP